nr:kyphoscoliosis peptidase-like [Zootoca vivipara]
MNFADYPWDKSNKKSIQIDLEKFKELDAYAQKVDIRNSVKNLVSVLLKKAHGDLEKVRAIWMWICHHIEYDVEGCYNLDKVSFKPADILQSGKAICGGYARLFQEMCSIAGIQCEYLRGSSNVKGKSNHAWNAVRVDGRWHLLDCTWGSGTVDTAFSKFTFRYDEFYFLTHPALFIKKHFPEDPKWQLLKQMVTLEEFEHQYDPDLHTAGLTGAVIRISTTENGYLVVYFLTHPVLIISTSQMIPNGSF